MANRPVYRIKDSQPYYEEILVDFEYYPGFSLKQKQRTIASLHKEYLLCNKEAKILEISTKSKNFIGISLSAFQLMISTKRRKYSVECAFQGSKVFQNGGPYIDLFNKSSAEAKKDVRLRTSGKLIEFEFYNRTFPLQPVDYFYNWLYINALQLNRKLSKDIMLYDSFTDIEFNPKISINCQAKAAAMFVGLKKAGKLEAALEEPREFLRIVYGIK